MTRKQLIAELEKLAEQERQSYLLNKQDYAEYGTELDLKMVEYTKGKWAGIQSALELVKQGKRG